MKYRIISVGKIREPFYQDGVNEYLKRVTPYATVELIEGLEEKINPRAADKEIQKILHKEGQKIINMLGNNDLLVVLDIRGRLIKSEDLASTMETWHNSVQGRVNLVIGGSHGLSTEVKQKADLAISFSPMTFPHQMAVLMLTEQLYRGFKILKGEKYHK